MSDNTNQPEENLNDITTTYFTNSDVQIKVLNFAKELYKSIDNMSQTEVYEPVYFKNLVEKASRHYISKNLKKND